MSRQMMRDTKRASLQALGRSRLVTIGQIFGLIGQPDETICAGSEPTCVCAAGQTVERARGPGRMSPSDQIAMSGAPDPERPESRTIGGLFLLVQSPLRGHMLASFPNILRSCPAGPPPVRRESTAS
jgi:hypothetical protein